MYVPNVIAGVPLRVCDFILLQALMLPCKKPGGGIMSELTQYYSLSLGEILPSSFVGMLLLLSQCRPELSY